MMATTDKVGPRHNKNSTWKTRNYINKIVLIKSVLRP